jgi:hypothetical protein
MYHTFADPKEQLAHRLIYETVWGLVERADVVSGTWLNPDIRDDGHDLWMVKLAMDATKTKDNDPGAWPTDVEGALANRRKVMRERYRQDAVDDGLRRDRTFALKDAVLARLDNADDVVDDDDDWHGMAYDTGIVCDALIDIGDLLGRRAAWDCIDRWSGESGDVDVDAADVDAATDVFDRMCVMYPRFARSREAFTQSFAATFEDVLESSWNGW